MPWMAASWITTGLISPILQIIAEECTREGIEEMSSSMNLSDEDVYYAMIAATTRPICVGVHGSGMCLRADHATCS